MTLRPAKPMTGALCPASRPRPVKPAGAFFIGLEDVRVQAWAFMRMDRAPWPRLVRGWVNAAKIVPTPSFFSRRAGLSVVGLSTALSPVPRPSLNLGLALATPSLPLFPLSLSTFAHVFS